MCHLILREARLSCVCVFLMLATSSRYAPGGAWKSGICISIGSVEVGTLVVLNLVWECQRMAWASSEASAVRSLCAFIGRLASLGSSCRTVPQKTERSALGLCVGKYIIKAQNAFEGKLET